MAKKMQHKIYVSFLQSEEYNFQKVGFQFWTLIFFIEILLFYTVIPHNISFGIFKFIVQ